MLRFTDNVIGQMTRDCNLRCKYCYEGKDPKWCGKMMTVPQFKETLDTLLYERCILGRIENRVDWHFHGGEVLLIPWEDLKQMIEYVEERHKFFPGLTWGIQTNGLNITPEIAKYFVEKHHCIGLSFDGFDVDDRMPPERNRKFIEMIKSYHEQYGTEFSFLMVFSKKNMKTWLKDARYLLTFSNQVGLNPLCACGEYEQYIPTADDTWNYWYKPVLESFLTEEPLYERGIWIETTKLMSQLIFNLKDLNKDKTGCFDRICGTYSNMIAIDPNFNVHPCDKYLDDGPYAFLTPSKSLKSRDFLGLNVANTAIHHYQQMFKLEKDLHCDICPSRLICPGDCQSYQMSKRGHVYINKNNCWLYQKVFEFVNEHLIEILENNPYKVEYEVDGINPLAMDRFNKANKKLQYDIITKVVSVIDREGGKNEENCM